MNIETKRVGQLPAQLRKILTHLTQRDWTLNISSGTQGITLMEENKAALAAKLAHAKTLPFMKELISAFPTATVTMET
jgi:hypothetical protein